jgi:hypothetical protein
MKNCISTAAGAHCTELQENMARRALQQKIDLFADA